MMTPEQLDNWFSYHAPTDETAPKYAAILEAEGKCGEAIYRAVDATDDTYQARHDYINEACRTFAVLIDGLAPDSADKTAAIRCVRLARNAANEAVRISDLEISAKLHNVAMVELAKARWQANSAIACGGK